MSNLKQKYPDKISKDKKGNRHVSTEKLAFFFYFFLRKEKSIWKQKAKMVTF